MSDPSRRLAQDVRAGSLPLTDVVAILGRLVGQVEALHSQGRLHGAIAAAETSGEIDDWKLPKPVDPVPFGSLAEDMLPPEAGACRLESLPADIAAARQAIVAAGHDFDPRRIDIVQIAAAALRFAADLSVEEYLNSARARKLLPSPLASVIDGMLGYDPSHRWTICQEIQAALAAAPAAEAPAASSDTPPHGSFIGVGEDTPPQGLCSVEPPAAISGSTEATLPFSKLGKYKIVEQIGAGGMGDVFKAYEADLDRFVAIKVLPSALSRQAEFVRRFQSEAMAAAKLGHPNIVRVFNIGEDGGVHFFVMEFVEGESLAERLKREGKLRVEPALEIVEQALAGLAAAHRQGMVHRDIKPGNILLDRQHHRAMLADFGLVKSAQASAGMTATGVVMGTADYISPEQARGKEVDGRADLYSMGVLLYQLLSGRLPFQADSPTSMIFQHAYEQAKPLLELEAETPAPVAEIVARLMQKSPADRYASADDVLADLRAYRAGLPPPFVKVSPTVAGDEAASPRAADSSESQFAATASLGNLAGESAKTSIFQAAGRQVHRLLRRHAPEVVERYANTQQQFDGAIDDYRQRRDELARLVADAEAAQGELAAQAESHRAAAAAAASDLERDRLLQVAAEMQDQADGQDDDLATLRVRLAEANAKLGRLLSQRDAMQARLASAAHYQGASHDKTLSTWVRRGAIAAVASVMLLVGFGGYRIFFGGTTTAIDQPEEPEELVLNLSTSREVPSPLDQIMSDAIQYYSFDPADSYEQDGRSYLRDLTGHGIDGAIQGPAFDSAGHAGHALRFDGRDDHIDIPDVRKAILETPQAVTVSCWVNGRPGNDYGAIFDVGFYANASVLIGIDQKDRFVFCLPTDYGGTCLLGNPHTAGWHHVVGVWDGTYQRIYVDGVKEAEFLTEGLTLNEQSLSPHPARMGVHAKSAGDNNRRRFVGLVDDFAIFRRALGAEEVATLHQAKSEEVRAALTSVVGKLAPVAGGSTISKSLGATEIKEITASLEAKYPAVIAASEGLTLVSYYDATEFKRNAGNPTTIPASYSASPVQGSNGFIMTWGNNQSLQAGSYLVVYRMQLHSEVESGEVCFLDVCTGGNTISGHRPEVSQFTTGGWSNLPVALTLDKKTAIECRMWPLNHVVSLDRVYIFRLIPKVSGARLLRTFSGHSGTIIAADITTDGSRVASGADDGTVRIWDAKSGETLSRLTGLGGGITDVAFSADASTLAASSRSGRSIGVWNTSTNSLVSRIAVNEEGFEKIDLSADGRRVVANGRNTVRVFDTLTGEQLYGAQGSGYAMAISPTGDAIAYGGWDKIVFVHRLNGSAEQFTYDKQETKIYALDISSDGKLAASGDPGGSIHIWNFQTGEQLSVLKGHTGEIAHVAFSADAKRLISFAFPHDVRVWDVTTGKVLVDFPEATIIRPAISADGQQYLIGQGELLELWDRDGSA